MCLNCGCHDAHDDHGNPANITMDKMQKAADASDISVEKAADNIKSGLTGAGKGGH
jgi:hypothetical protein